MRLLFLLRISIAVLALAVVLSACGQTAAPPATPVKATPAATATAAPVTAPTPSPTGGTAPQNVGVAASLYAPDVLKELIAQNFYFGGQQYGAGIEPKYGGTAVFSNRGDLPSADPMLNATNTFANVIGSVLGNGTLVRPKRSNVFEPEPYLATSWTPDADYMNWTFKVRPGVKWHDGTPLTAEDLKFWIDLAYFPSKGRPSSYPGQFGPLDKAIAVDDLTLKLAMKSPAPFLLESLSVSGGVTHQRRQAKPVMDGGKALVDMADAGWVALGPFKYENYQKGSSFKAVRSEVYWEKDERGKAMPYLDGIYYPFIPDSTVMVSAFRAGRIDATARGTGFNLTPDQVNNIKKTLADKAWFPRLPYVAWGPAINALAPPFDDIRVRNALNLYADRAEGIKLAHGGFALPSAIMAPGSAWYNSETPMWPGFNPKTKAADQAEAKRLMKAAGVEGMPIKVQCRDLWLQECEFLELTLRGMGFNPTLEVMDFAILQNRVRQNNYLVAPYSSGAAEAGKLLPGYLTNNPAAITKHNDPKIDEFSKAIDSTVDPVARKKLVQDAEKYIVVDKSYYPAWYTEDAVFGYRTYLKGEWVAGYNVGNLNEHATVWMDNSAR